MQVPKRRCPVSADHLEPEVGVSSHFRGRHLRFRTECVGAYRRVPLRDVAFQAMIQY